MQYCKVAGTINCICASVVFADCTKPNTFSVCYLEATFSCAETCMEFKLLHMYLITSVLEMCDTCEIWNSSVLMKTDKQ